MRWLTVLLVGGIFAAIYTAEGVWFRDFNQDEYQIATAYLKDRDPGLFSSDFIWGKPEMIRNLHVCVRKFMGWSEAATLGFVQEPVDLHLVWLPICQVIFFVGIYLLAFRFSKHHAASLLVACSFMLVRRTIWDWWGLGPTYTMSPRGVLLAFIPLALWGWFQCGASLRRQGFFFLGWGVLSNLHPLSGWGFVEFLGITILVVDRFSLSAWKQVILAGTATLLGSAPFLWEWMHVIRVPVEQMADPSLTKGFWDGFMGLEAPPVIYLYRFLEDLAIPFLLALGGWLAWKRQVHDSEKREWHILGVFPVVAVITTVAVMFVGWLGKKNGYSVPVMFPEHGRNIKMIYLTFPAWMALGIAAWIQWMKHPVWKWAPPILIVLASMSMNLGGHKLARAILAERNWLPAREIQKYQEKIRNDSLDMEVARWAREHSAVDALFYFDSYEFRYQARRSLVFCWFDRPCVGFRPTKELEVWIRRRDQVKPLKDAGDGVGMMEAARGMKADYLVTLNEWRQPSELPVWKNPKYSVYAVSR